jgi:hypothetical protein
MILITGLLGLLSAPAAAESDWIGGFAEYPVLSDSQKAVFDRAQPIPGPRLDNDWMSGHAEYPVLAAPLTAETDKSGQAKAQRRAGETSRPG